MAFLRQQQTMFRTDPSANLTDSEVNFIFETYSGKPSFDCIGLIKAYEWIDEDTGVIRYRSNGFQDIGANGMLEARKSPAILLPFRKFRALPSAWKATSACISATAK